MYYLIIFLPALFGAILIVCLSNTKKAYILTAHYKYDHAIIDDHFSLTVDDTMLKKQTFLISYRHCELISRHPLLMVNFTQIPLFQKRGRIKEVKADGITIFS